MLKKIVVGRLILNRLWSLPQVVDQRGNTDGTDDAQPPSTGEWVCAPVVEIFLGR